MPDTYSLVKSVIVGELITADDRNAEHTNHKTMFNRLVDDSSYDITITPEKIISGGPESSIQRYTDFATAIATIAATQTTLVIDEDTTVLSDETIPSTLSIRGVSPGMFSIATGVTLTINGPCDIGLLKFFNCVGTGKVVFGGLIDKAYPQWWGAKADGVTDDTVAIRSMIAAVGTIGGECVFPYGETGVYLVGSRIVEGTILPSGLAFRGLRRVGGNSNGGTEGVVIKYTSTDICWDIQTPDGLGDIGGWVWENLTFATNTQVGGMFQFNDITREMTIGVDSPMHINHVAFKACTFWGAGGAMTGNAIQALGLFELSVDSQCFFRNWKRAIYLKGCNNYTLAGNYVLNGRNIQTTTSGTFGFDGNVFANFLGNSPPTADIVEDSYNLWVGDNRCMVWSPHFETQQTANSGGSKGQLYLSGWGTHVYSPNFGMDASQSSPNNVVLKLGAGARDCKIINPHDSGSMGAGFDIEAPTSWEWRDYNSGQANYQLTIINPNEFFSRIFSSYLRHPRIKVIGNAQYDYEQIQNLNGLISSQGASLGNMLLTPYSLARGQKQGGSDYIEDVIADVGGYDGKAMVLGFDPWGSALLEYVVGRDIQEGDTILLSVYYREQSAAGASSLYRVVQKNQATVTQGALANSATYTQETFSYTLSGFSVGDEIGIGVYNQSDVKVNLACLSVTIVQVANADTSLTFTGGDTVSKSEVVDLQTEVNQIKAALRAMKIIAP